ncbi:hypothetical protein MPNT_70093 [Candidatus Methylacidithermus pantelleriae]|uniref:Uncharacterized protein n=1 Tax=Candidatus Methylacidithermus pantelleriae TaxID=2744239 RepID=A0A8J2BM16_9BACT|nr:hypothetical protein MPNT_70093 [Candidatus Methylacidithermus pantelleriae]
MPLSGRPERRAAAALTTGRGGDTKGERLKILVALGRVGLNPIARHGLNRSRLPFSASGCAPNCGLDVFSWWRAQAHPDPSAAFACGHRLDRGQTSR